MFKVGRWRQEKIKIVFKLQFQVTQVPSSKSKLTLSVVPVDVGQPTVRLGKAAIQDGICTWENPVFESVKIIRETKTGKIHDKIYQFVISTGSSKSGFLGEVLVNLADYVYATEPSTISLPIKSSNAGAILHVTIQNMQGADDQRELQTEIEEDRTSIAYEGSLQSHDSNSQFEGEVDYRTHEDGYHTTMAPVNSEGEMNIRNGDTLNSLFGQKENRNHQEAISDQSPNKMISKDSRPAEKERQVRKPLTLDWTSSDEDDISNYVEDTNGNFLREHEQEPPKSLVEQLERENFALKRQAEVTDIELQSLRRQIVKETKRAQELSGKVVRLRQEREELRRESEKTRSEQNGANGIDCPQDMGIENKKSRNRLNGVDEDLVHAKDFNRALRSQLRKTQDSNSELILVVRGLEEKLGKKEKELDNLTRKYGSDRKSEEFQDFNSEVYSDKELEREPSPNTDPTEVNSLQQQIKNLQDDMEGHLKENRELQEQIKQFSQDYETAKRENDDLSSKFNQKQLELIKKERECTHNTRRVEELQSQIARLEKVIHQQAEEFRESSDTIQDLETQVNNLKCELERQAEEFEDEVKAMTNAKVELEQKALQTEENLRKTKVDNASAAQRLQEEFRELSEELEAKFKENEDLTIKKEAESRELRLYIDNLEEHLEKVTRELESVQNQSTDELEKLSTQLKDKEKEHEQLLLAHKDENVELINIKKKVEDKCEALSKENQALRMEVERLTEENYYSTKKVEELEIFVDETNRSFQDTKTEREELETKYTLARTEIEQAQEELKFLRPLKEKVDDMAGMHSELEKLQVQHNELKNRLSEMKSENENLRKQLTRQKEHLQKKDSEIANLEKNKESISKEVLTLKEKVKQLKAVRPSGISPESGSKVDERKTVKKLPPSATSGKPLQNGAAKTSGESRRETCIEKKVTNDQSSDLLTEVALLKEKNKKMEDELQEMQDKYSEVSLKFAEVEGERQQLVMTIRNLKNGQKK